MTAPTLAQLLDGTLLLRGDHLPGRTLVASPAIHKALVEAFAPVPAPDGPAPADAQAGASSAPGAPPTHRYFYLRMGTAVKVDDAGDLKHVLIVQGANEEHSERLAAWLVDELNKASRKRGA